MAENQRKSDTSKQAASAQNALATGASSEKSATAAREEEVLSFWKEHHIFEKSVEKEAPQGEFVFYDGPPFATGLPHQGSLLSSIIKDVVPRYKTMRGYRVYRRWGWDCHGLPIENLVEKQLGLKTKKDIEKIGIDVFNETARASVLTFEREWAKYIDRVGRFVDFWHSYKTMDNSYIESVWWALKQFYEKGLMYEGRKVLMYCPHDETPLAKAEIAADNTYKDITEEAVTVKLKLTNPEKIGLSGDVYLLAWTTTPWTLPGNVALAVGKDIEYVAIKTDPETQKETLILAKNILENSNNILNTIAQPAELKSHIHTYHAFKGIDLVGLSYEPLFDFPEIAKSDKSYKVYAADFVSTNEGTGIVHTAVMYGEDDFALGQRENLPMVQMLDASAHYNDAAPLFLRGQYIKKAEKEIVADLEKRGLLFEKAMHTHSYPHCWRCGTPLIYNAVPSWFINIQKIKTRLLEENEKITWVPEHLKHGRFKNIVENAPDWTISRNRFWASPLPIWKSKEGKVLVIGSLAELKRRVKKSGNRYFLMRHGEAEQMLKNIVTIDPKNEYGLTLRGKEQVIEAAKSIPRDPNKPFVIISSPVRRTRESAEILASELGVPQTAIVLDDRLREIGFGEFDGKIREEWLAFIENPGWYTIKPLGGESFAGMKVRFGQAIYDYESKYQNSTVIIVSHVIAFDSLIPICEGSLGNSMSKTIIRAMARPGEVQELPFVPLPLNKKFELDLHRPYTDSLILLDDEGNEYTRIPEVVDCWVESGAMPFASYADAHNLSADFGSDKKPDEIAQKIPYPADFIAEYIAQTRTWFYYLHAVGVGLFDRASFRAVVSTGTILAADGTKMSKSKGNYTDPLELMDHYGADAARFYLMGSVVMQSEDLNFRDEDVREAHNRVIGILWNSYKFFELYKGEYDGKTQSIDSPHVLDRWIRSCLGEVLREVTDAYEKYDMPAACRSIKAFIEDYSTWYVRRSRDRVRGNADREDKPTYAKASADKQYCLATQQEILNTFAKVIAPIMPFIAEDIYKGTGGKKESVHLAWWPQEIPVDGGVLINMSFVRSFATIALMQRDKAGIKVRQPLGSFTIKHAGEPLAEEYLDILRDEINVKRIIFMPGGPDEPSYKLDTDISEELKLEGQLRDVVRAVQDARKREGLSVKDRPMLKVSGDSEGKQFFERFHDEIILQTGLASLETEEEAVSEGEKSLPFKARFQFLK